MGCSSCGGGSGSRTASNFSTSSSSVVSMRSTPVVEVQEYIVTCGDANVSRVKGIMSARDTALKCGGSFRPAN